MACSTPPTRFLCPITQELMNDPVMTPQGHNFERSSITEWLRSHNDCPLTREPLSINEIFPNRALKDGIEEWRASNKDGSPLQGQQHTSPAMAPTVPSPYASAPPLPPTQPYQAPVAQNEDPWVKFGMSRDEYDRVFTLFLQFDDDDSGEMDRDEARKFCKVLNYPHGSMDIDRMFRESDTDGNGSIDFEEFLTYMLDKRPRPEEKYGVHPTEYQEILMSFHQYDTNSDGELDKGELRSLCKSMGWPHQPHVLDSMFYEMDTDRSGTLDVDEFLRWMKYNRGALMDGRPTSSPQNQSPPPYQQQQQYPPNPNNYPHNYPANNYPPPNNYPPSNNYPPPYNPTPGGYSPPASGGYPPFQNQPPASYPPPFVMPPEEQPAPRGGYSAGNEAPRERKNSGKGWFGFGKKK